jgi:hypothetical protein
MVSMPKPNDPYQTAAAQTGQNVMSSIGSSIIGNANEITPYGNVTYSPASWETMTDPSTGQTWQIPRYNRTTTLSPQQQGLLNLQNASAKNLGETAVQQSQMLKGLLKTPLNTQGLQDWTALPQWNEAAFSGDRNRVEQALMSRWHDVNDPQWAQRESTLAARGLTPGAAGYGYAADEHARAMNDATYGAITAGGQEQSRLLGEQAKRADFGNQLRGAQFGERQTLQSFPVNLITALMSGSQVNVPQAAPYRSTGISPAPIADIMAQNYQDKLQQSSLINQGIFGFAGDLIGMPWKGMLGSTA